MTEHAYLRVKSIEEALQSAKAHRGSYVYSAGGTDLAIRQRQGLIRQPVVVDLCDIANLHAIRGTHDGLEIGAMVTLDELAASPETRLWCRIIAEAAASMATPVIRLTATVGGNLLVANRCTFYNQSSFWRAGVGSCLRDLGDTCLATGSLDKCYSRGVSDLAPVFVALDATVIIHDQNGRREFPLFDLYAPDGMRYHANLENDAILVAIRLTTRTIRAFYRKIRGRQSIDFSSLTAAGTVDESDMIRVCLNGASPSPVRLEMQCGRLDLGKMQSLARRASKTVDNDLMPLKYRRDMIDTLLEDMHRALLPSQDVN
jgi:4-hydroxybenzoyl-CoA reductase subunit beta